MLVQIYEVTSPDEASALAEIGVDHIGVLVGEGEFPREQPVEVAKRIFSTIAPRVGALHYRFRLTWIP
jgi:phosphoribosylanthranilate isomerase